MSKEKIKKAKSKILAVCTILMAILLIVSISVNANKTDDYAVEIKDDGSLNIAKDENSSVTKKIVEDTSRSLTYEVQVNNLLKSEKVPQVAIVIDSSRSMSINDLEGNAKTKALQLMNELKKNEPKTQISISSNSGVKVAMGKSDVSTYTTAINAIGYSDGYSVEKAIDYAKSTFSSDADKYLVIFSDATDSTKEKLEQINDEEIKIFSMLTEITNSEYETSTKMGSVKMLSKVENFSEIYYKVSNSIVNVEISDVFSAETIEYFDFEIISKDDEMQIEETSNGYIYKCTQVKQQETKTLKYKLTLKDNVNIDAGKIYRTLNSSDSFTIKYKDSSDNDYEYKMSNFPTFVICKKYSLTIKAVSEKSDELPVENLDVKVVGTIVTGQDDFGQDIVKTIFDDTLTTDSKGKILIDDLKTLGDITFEIKPIVNQFGYQETSATQIIVHNDPTGVGTIWAESDVTTPEVDVVSRNITVKLPISVETFDMTIITTDYNNDKIALGNAEFRLIQPKLNSKYDMEAIYATTDSEGKVTIKPTLMTKDGSYQYILSQMTTQEGYDMMGNVTLIVTFENGKVTNIVSKYNELVTTDPAEKNSNKTVVRIGNVCQEDDTFFLEINLKDSDTNEALFGGIYDIEVSRVTAAGEQVSSTLKGYITDTDGKIKVEIPGNGYINLKIIEKSPKSGYVADDTAKSITFLRKNGTVQYISSKSPVSINAEADSDNNTVIVNLTSTLASEQNRLQISLSDNDEIDAKIPGVLLGINKVGETSMIQAITNKEGIANFILPAEEKGSYNYEIHLLSATPSGYLAPSTLLATVKVKYNDNKFIYGGEEVSSTVPYVDVSFAQTIEEMYKYDTAKVDIRLEPDPAYAYKLKIALVDDTDQTKAKPLAGGKYSILMESDGEEVKYLAGKLTDKNGNYTTRIVGGGKEIKITITETSTVAGYILTTTTQVIELELTDNGYELINSSPNVYDPDNGEYIGAELVGKELIYHDVNKCKTGANTILNLYINKMDQNDLLVSGVRVRLQSDTLKDSNNKPLDYLYDTTDGNGNSIKKDYYVTDQNGYFEVLGIKVQGDKLNNGERIDYLYMNELDEEGNVKPNTDITLKLTFRLNKETNVVEITNVEATWGNRLVKSRTYSSRETAVAYESDVYLDLFTNFDDVGNFSLDLKKQNKDGKELPESKYDIIVMRPDGTTLVRRDIIVNDSVELEGILVSKGTKIEITEKQAPIGYDINTYTEVLTITDVNTITGLVTCKLESSKYSTPRAEIVNEEPIISSEGTYKLCVTLALTDYETDTFKFGITAKDATTKNPIENYTFKVSTSEGAQKNFNPTNKEGKTQDTLGANYETEDFEVTYTIDTYKVADYYKKLEKPIEVKVVFDINGEVNGAKTQQANKNAEGFKTIWNIEAVNTVDGNDIDVVINVEPCDPLVVNIKTQDTITNKEITNITYEISPSINLEAKGTTKIEVGYVLPNGIQTYTIKQTNVDTVENYIEIPEQKINITYDENGNVIEVEELTDEVHKISINGKEIEILIDAEPAVPFNMKNIAYFHNDVNIVNAKFEISVDGDKTKEIITDTMGEDTIYSGSFEENNSKIYTIKQTNAGTGYAKVNDFQIKVTFDADKNITNAEILGDVNQYVEFVEVAIKAPSQKDDKGYNGNDKGIVNITVKSYPQVEFKIENVDRRDETIKLAGTVYKVESHKEGTNEIYTKDEQIITGKDGIGTAKLDKSGYRETVIYTITELTPAARYQTLAIPAVIRVEFDEHGYIINSSIDKRADVLEIIDTPKVEPEDNVKLHLKIKSNPELKVNITKVDEEDTSVLLPNVSFELTARIEKDKLSEYTEEEKNMLTLNTTILSEEEYLAIVLDRLKIDREDVENLRKTKGIANIIDELKNNNNLSAEEEDSINSQINDNLKINKIVELGKLTKTQINQKINEVTNSAIIDTLITENKTSRDTVNDLLQVVKDELRLDVDNVVTDANGYATAYMDKTLANKTIQYTLKETKKAVGYDWLSEVVIFEVTYDANGKMVADNPVRVVSGNMEITAVEQDEFEISVTVKNTPSKEIQIHLTVEDVYDSNKKLETAIFDAYLVDTENSITYAPDNNFRTTLETGSQTMGTNLTTAHGEDTESIGIYDVGAGTRILRFVEKQVPTSYYIGNDKFDSTYQSIKYALLLNVSFDDEGRITATSLHGPGSDTQTIGYIADGRYIQVSHTRNTINVTIRYYPMLQIQMQARDMYTKESIVGNYTIDTYRWGVTNGSDYIVSAGYINPYYYDRYYGYTYYGKRYNARYVTSDKISSVQEANRLAIAPTEADSFAENKNPNKDNRERILYVYENAEPTKPLQYQTYLPRYIGDSTQYLLAILKVKYDDLGQIENVELLQENSSTNISSGFVKTVKANVNEHTIELVVEYAPITTINATVIDEVSGAGLSGIRINPYLGGTNVTNTSYEYRTTLYYTTNSNGKTAWTYWGASIPDTLNRYVLDTYTVGSGYEGYFDPGNIILDVAYDENGRISAVTPKSTDSFGDVNAVDITWKDNNINVTIRYSRKFNVKLNKVDYYDSNKKLNAAFDIVSSNGVNTSMAANTVTTLGKVYAGKTVKYTLSETTVPSGYIPVENMDIMVDFNNNGSIRSATSLSQYFEFVKSAPVDSKTNSLKKTDLEANIKNKPRFDISIELTDKYYPSLKLEGGTFSIENSKGEKASGGVQTDANGILETYVGTVYPNEDVLYTIKQTSIIPGYYENTAVIRFNVHFNSNGKIESYTLIDGTDVATMNPTVHIGTKAVKVNITNRPKDVRLGMYKYDEVTKEPMQAVGFTLTTKEEGKVDSTKTVVSKENGTVIEVVDQFEETDGKNRVVTYLISEIDAPKSYREIQDIEIKVTYKPDGSIYLYDVISNPSEVGIQVATIDQIKYIDDTPVHIQLWIPNDNAYDLIVKNEDSNYKDLGIEGTSYDVSINGIVMNPITTDENGIAMLKNQQQNGTITIAVTEKEIGEGYRQNNNNFTVITVEKGKEEYTLDYVDHTNKTYATVEVDEIHGTITVTFKNETKLELTVQKNDINTGAVLEDVVFEIKEEELDNAGQVITGTEKIITTLGVDDKTDINGLLYFDLGLSKQNKTIRYTFTETTPPAGYTQILPMTMTVKFNAYGHITEMKDDSFRLNETLASETGKSHHMIAIIGNGTVNEEYTVKIVTQDSQSGRRLNGSIFEVEAIDGNGATNKRGIGATTNVSSTIAGNTKVLEQGVYKLKGITAEGNVQIRFRQIETAVGYVYGNNQTSGTITVNASFNITASKLEEKVTLTKVDDAGFDVEIDNVNREITIKLLNDPEVDFEITKIDAGTEKAIEGAKFNITSEIVVSDGINQSTGINNDIEKTDDEGFTQANVGYSYAGKTVIYTISEEQMIGYQKLDDIILAVQYDVNGNISQYKILSDMDVITIKEDATKKIKKRTITEGEITGTIDDIDTQEFEIPTGKGSKILQMEIKNFKEPSDYRIQIGKYHEDTTYPNLIPGAKYEITVKQEYGKAETTWTDITDEKGIIISPYFSGYGWIEISITELEAPEGYKIDELTRTTRMQRDESSGKIVIHSSDVGAKLNEDYSMVYLEPVDEVLSGLYDIILNKVDSKTGALIENNPATIKLDLLEEIETVTQTVNPDTGEIIENVSTSTIRTSVLEEATDENGRIIAEKLNAPSEPGEYTYILTEVKAPKEYEPIEEKEVQIVVTFDTNEDQEIVISNVAVKDAQDVKAGRNSDHVMSIIVYNTSNEDGSTTLLEDEFGIDLRKVNEELYPITGSIAKFTLTNVETSEVTPIETDELGRAQLAKFKMPTQEGIYKYLLNETEAPEGYKLFDGDINIMLEFLKDAEGKMYLNKVDVIGSNVVYTNKAQDGELPDRKISLKVINEEAPYKIIIEKHHEADPYYPGFIANVEFDIKITQEFGDTIETVKTTNEDGIIEIEGLEGYGRIKIEITEKSAPGQYKVDFATKHLEIYRDKFTKELREYDSSVNYEFNQKEQEIILKPVNELRSGIYDLVINKVDKDTDKVITNNPATFNLYMIKNYDGGEIKVPIIENKETDDLGMLVTDFVEMPTEKGVYTYELEEVKSPSGYKGLESPVRYQITVEPNDDGDLIITDVKVLDEKSNLKVITFKKQFISLAVLNENAVPDGKVQIELNKVDEQGQSITTDTAVFKGIDDITNEIQYAETDKNAKAQILFDIPEQEGLYTYTINEIKAPEGYALDRNNIKVTLEYAKDDDGKIFLSKVRVNGSNVEYIKPTDDDLSSRNIELKVTNKVGSNGNANDKPYTVIVNKIDEDTKQHITERATFDVALVNGEIVHASTNEQGQMIIENVHMPSQANEYEIVVKETKAPEGYILDDELKIIKVTFTGIAKNMVISKVESAEGNKNIEVVESECTEDKIVLNVLNKSEDEPLYVVSKKYDSGEDIYDLMDSFEGRQYKIDKPFIDTKVAKSGNNVTVEEFINNLESNGVLTVWDKDGNQITDTSRVKTGMILKATKGKQELTFDIVVKGDIDGDGRVRSKDLDILTKHLSEAEKITDPLLMRAADILDDGKGRVRSNDLDEFYKVLSK